MRGLNNLLDTRRISKIVLLFGAFNVILCETRTKSETIASEMRQVLPSSCTNSPICRLSNTYKTRSRSLSFSSYPNSQNHDGQRSNLQRSYYGGFDTSASPSYYHAFDPISVLASLAFLAFLLQSFASLFERSRSMLPTIVSGRQTTANLPEIPEHVSRVLQEYEILNEDLRRK